ncbi:DICT sensory domain-containing protein [Halorarum salinum]|uniref:Sensor protein n=1 Tax=Halorarum salinum TaxID=2743089 RepID=A0A7D5LCI6_9EURY|nr:DICT sensory domain-containing protein [Halobaculum salinum]QLG63390.1 sensor protein [Halobaculum salinum]
MTLGSLLEDAERRRLSVIAYGASAAAVADRFETRNATVERRPLPADAPAEFVVVRDAGFRGAIGSETLETFLSPPIRRPWDLDSLSPAYRALFDLLDDAVFASLNRRQLLATAREFEDRAYRVGHGTLRVGFQSASAFRAQEEVYRWLVAETDLDVHVYVAPEDARGVDRDRWPVTFHTEPAEEIGRYWFLVFDGAGDDERTFSLVAEEHEDGKYYGFWTYDPATVERAIEALI